MATYKGVISVKVDFTADNDTVARQRLAAIARRINEETSEVTAVDRLTRWGVNGVRHIGATAD